MGEPAASSISRVCSMSDSSPTLTSGWIPGRRTETLPKSVPAAIDSVTTPKGSGSRPRSRWALTQDRSNGRLSRTGISLGDPSAMISTPTPAMSPAPRNTSDTRRNRSTSVSGYFERTRALTSARCGMMLGTWPPSTMTAWTRSVGDSCCRSMLMPSSASTAASSALRPMNGAAEACAGTPVKTTRKRRAPSQV